MHPSALDWLENHCLNEHRSKEPIGIDLCQSDYGAADHNLLFNVAYKGRAPRDGVERDACDATA